MLFALGYTIYSMPPQALARKSFARPAASPKRARKNGRASLNGRPRTQTQFVVITGMSGSGKASVLKAFEDLGYYCVDNLPVELIPRFAELAKHSAQIERTALV